MLALIPARGGSKGVPRKNIRPLAGRPAIAWAIDACLRARHIDRVVVSTEDEEIAAAARAAGADVPFMRPAELATDTVPQGHACLHALDALAALEARVRDSFVLVQATSPLIAPGDIDGAIDMFQQRDAFAVVSVRPLETPVEAACEIAPDGHFVSVLRDRYGVDFRAARRQEFGKRYAICGAVTVLRVAPMRADVNYYWGDGRSLAFPLPADRGVDIDTQIDFDLAELLLNRRLAANTTGGR